MSTLSELANAKIIAWGNPPGGNRYAAQGLVAAAANSPYLATHWDRGHAQPLVR